MMFHYTKFQIAAEDSHIPPGNLDILKRDERICK